MDYSDAHQAGRRPEAAGRRPEADRGLARGETARADADRLGPYSLIAEISAGEFTTVHLARKGGVHGFDRLVAIKRLKPAYASQPEWSQLLLDEARLGASVDHPNTVDILDVGTDAGVYVVMDYVEGADLEQLLARAGRERHPRFVLPPIIDALTGLHAIHTQKDELGEPLAMVHQAPRARHILLGIHGVARVTDFSQVTARGLIPSTLRGKGLSPAYMAPEQVLVSEPVSARTDIFILGITLWEALTGERLFTGETPSLVRRAITERDIPKPSEMGLHPPRCFDSIVMRALQRNPEARYQSAAEMARDLREVAQEEALLATSSEIGQWVRALASRSLLERRRALGVDDRSEEIAIDVLEQQIAADKARNAAERESTTFARESIVIEEGPAHQVEDHELSPVIQVTPAITVPVSNAARRESASKREPTAELKREELITPKVPKRSATGTLLGVTSKPRSVGLPPPAASLQIKKGGSMPAYRGSLGRTALEAPRIEIKPTAQLATHHTLPEGGAFISDIELPIDLPTAKMDRPPSFVGFSRVIDVEAEPVTPASASKATSASASFGGAAAFATERVGVSEPVRTPEPQGVSAREEGGSGMPPASDALRATAAYDAPLRAEMPPAPRQPMSFNDATAPVLPVQSQTAQSWATPHSQAWEAPASSASGWNATPPSTPGRKPASATAWNEPSPAWEAQDASVPPTAHESTPAYEEKRRSDPPRSSRPSMHTLDGHVPKDVFDRLRAAGAGAESWRPPASAVQQPWPDEDAAEPRAYGRMVAIAAAIVVGGFFGFKQVMGGDARQVPPAAVHSARTAEPAAPVVAPSTPAEQVAPAAQQAEDDDYAPVEAAPAPQVVPSPRAAEPVAPVPPVSTFGRPSAEQAPAAAPVKRAAPRAPVRREEPLARPEQYTNPAPLARPAPLVRPAPQPAARPRSTYRPSETLPDNPY